MQREKNLHCEVCESSYRIEYDPADGEPETCPFCGADINNASDPVEEDEDD